MNSVAVSAAAPSPAEEETQQVEDAVRADTITLTIVKKSAGERVGVELAMTSDRRWCIVMKVEPGTLAAPHRQLKPGAKLLEVRANGVLYKSPPSRKAAEVISAAVGDVELTFMPLIDRYGFVVSQQDFEAGGVSREQVRAENKQVIKWQKRVSSEKAWNEYAARKPEKLKERIRLGVPDAVRGFVWKLLAAARAPAGFRQRDLYRSLLLREDLNADVEVQIDKDVRRTMAEHVYFRANGSRGHESLTRLLRAYAQFDKQIGYTQGMSHYAAVLLLYMTEEDAFWTFAILMKHCSVAGLFQDGFPLLFHCYDSWQTLFAKREPKLYKHVTKSLLEFQGLSEADFKEMSQQPRVPGMPHPALSLMAGQYTTSWFQGMLVGGEHPAPSALAPRVMDNLLLDGNLRVVFQIGLGLLGLRKPRLLRESPEELATSLKKILQTIDDVDKLMLTAYDVQVKAKAIEAPELPSLKSQKAAEKAAEGAPRPGSPGPGGVMTERM